MTTCTIQKGRIRSSAPILVLLSAFMVGCHPPVYVEMLGASIRSFSSRVQAPGVKVWVTGPNDNDCNSGCQRPQCGGEGKEGASAASGLSRLFGGGGGSGSHDKLAYEVITNYVTQQRKMIVIESHRHNYATQLNVQTRSKMETVGEGNRVTSGMSCEDLCLLDEAKKRKADKVLVFHIIEMSSDQLTIHYRLSDVPSGVVEAAQTLRVSDLRASDYSYGSPRE